MGFVTVACCSCPRPLPSVGPAVGVFHFRTSFCRISPCSGRMDRGSRYVISCWNLPGLNTRGQVLAILADNAKHNQTGRTDEHGAIRHRHVELCPVGGVAMMLWATFQLRNFPVPDFIPDFADPKFGEFGRRDWYNICLFFSSTGSQTEPMQYKGKSCT